MSARAEFRGDFMGFTYNGKHSSDLGIVRTSDGSRFNENLLPTMQDKTVQVPGGDGTYYFGSYYTQRQFSVSFAFDSLTEEQVAMLRTHFGDKGIYDLIFDERPYKVYRAKVTGTATLKYLSFTEGDTNRLYKGEGTIQFTCYEPFAHCWSTNKDDYYTHPAYRIKKGNGYKTKAELTVQEKNKITNSINEWWGASRIGSKNSNSKLIGNFGDIPVSFTKTITGTGEVKFSNDKYVSWKLPEGVTATLDTKLGIAKGSDGTIYNQYISGDIALKIPVGTLAEKTNNLTFSCYYF